MTIPNLDIEQMTPPSGRRRTLVPVLRRLQQLITGPPLIVEVGTIRNGRPRGQSADGWSTYVWGWYASQTEGQVITIDAHANTLETCKRVTDEFWPWIDYVLATPEKPATKILAGMNAQIDLLYLDGPHGSPARHEASAAIHLEWFLAPKHPPKIVLIDDAEGDDYGVKGRHVVPQALEDGYEILFHQHQQIALVRS